VESGDNQLAYRFGVPPKDFAAASIIPVYLQDRDAPGDVAVRPPI
jgi:hypothetical protein